jgi:hypothetical protein
MSDDAVTSTFHIYNAVQTTRTDNFENRVDVTIADDIANDAEVTTISDLVLGGLAPTSVAFLSGNDSETAIFAVALVDDEAVITIDDNTDVLAEDVHDLVVRVTYSDTVVDYPVEVTIEAA